MNRTRLRDIPAVADTGRRLAGAAAGSVLFCYGLVHLLVWPGAPTGTPGERYGWDGETQLLGWLPTWAVWTVGGILLTAAVLGHAVGGAGLAGLPIARRYRLTATGTGAAGSLALFAVTWPGLAPAPTEFSAGPVVSGLLLASVVATIWAQRHPPPASVRQPDRSRRADARAGSKTGG
ncbi:hypothetical protein [Frankia gtarii]|uniref:hypothetical protein n=1 Tax=Frankia gtarii TaxID=2950102 RepID=UPI0021BECDC0|nr:hypothetical protein [Frankia gtarii]